MRSAHADATNFATGQEMQIRAKQRRNCAHLLICSCTLICDIECLLEGVIVLSWDDNECHHHISNDIYTYRRLLLLID